MTPAPSGPAQSDRPIARQARPDEARAARLRAANINPRTGLATDYLNHFNEAIMLLEMIPDIPECVEDFLAWRPLSYREHFMASNFKARELAIEAYVARAAMMRAEFENIPSGMPLILIALSTAMSKAPQDKTRRIL